MQCLSYGKLEYMNNLSDINIYLFFRYEIVKILSVYRH